MLCCCLQAHQRHRSLQLAQAPDQLAALREKLARNRDTQPLFDTPRFTRHLEPAYPRIWELTQAGLPPEHLDIPA